MGPRCGGNAMHTCQVRTMACSRNQHNMGHRRGSGLHQKESTDYDQTVSERAYGKHSVLAQVHLVRRQQSHHGTASPPQNQREGIREWKGEKEKAKIRMYYEVGHYLG